MIESAFPDIPPSSLPAVVNPPAQQFPAVTEFTARYSFENDYGSIGGWEIGAMLRSMDQQRAFEAHTDEIAQAFRTLIPNRESLDAVVFTDALICKDVLTAVHRSSDRSDIEREVNFFGASGVRREFHSCIETHRERRHVTDMFNELEISPEEIAAAIASVNTDGFCDAVAAKIKKLTGTTIDPGYVYVDVLPILHTIAKDPYLPAAECDQIFELAGRYIFVFNNCLKNVEKRPEADAVGEAEAAPNEFKTCAALGVKAGIVARLASDMRESADLFRRTPFLSADPRTVEFLEACRVLELRLKAEEESFKAEVAQIARKQITPVLNLLIGTGSDSIELLRTHLLQVVPEILYASTSSDFCRSKLDERFENFLRVVSGDFNAVPEDFRTKLKLMGSLLSRSHSDQPTDLMRWIKLTFEILEGHTLEFLRVVLPNYIAE